MNLEAHEEKVGFSNSNSSLSQPSQPENFICSFMQLLEIIKKYFKYLPKNVIQLFQFENNISRVFV
jgi:hypothetical protein